MRDNVPATPEELASLTAAAVADPELPPIVGIDEEGGDVVRLPYDELPGAGYLRGVASNETTDAFAARAELLASVGVNLNFGIVADYTADPNSFIHSRTLGDDPASAADHVAAAVGAETPLVASTLKHFPGHGRTNADSHNGIPVTDVSFDEWRTTDALPFEAGIKAGAPAVMFGHLVFSSVDATPASLSVAWHEILRKDLGFTGLAVTDDLLMLQSSGVPELADPYANAVAALSAGNDVLLYVLPSDPSTVGIDVPTLVSALVANVSAERLDESALRVAMFRRALAPDALTWVPPCDLACLANEVGGYPPFDPLILLSETPAKK
jgi:beta-N-acetylhexosaminidase